MSWFRRKKKVNVGEAVESALQSLYEARRAITDYDMYKRLLDEKTTIPKTEDHIRQLRFELELNKNNARHLVADAIEQLNRTKNERHGRIEQAHPVLD